MLAERAGRAHEEINVPVGATLSDLQQVIWDRHPSLREAGAHGEGGISLIRWAVNSRIVSPATSLAHGDEVALLAGAAGG